VTDRRTDIARRQIPRYAERRAGKTHKPIVEYDNAKSIPNNRRYTMNTRKKFLR